MNLSINVILETRKTRMQNMTYMTYIHEASHSCLDMCLQTGVGVIPCTGSIEHLKENSPDELLSFELDEEMMWRLNSMWRLLVPLK